MKNVAIIITKLNGGGAERSAANLSIELSKKYNVVLVVFDGRNITYPYEGTLIDLQITSSNNSVSRIINMIKRIVALKKIKKKYNISCTISLLEGPNLVNVLSRVNDKVIISVRSLLSSLPLRKFRIKSIVYSSMKADLTISLSEMVRQDLISNFGIPDTKVKTIYNHCDADLLHSLVRDTPKPSFIDDKSVYIATMGRLTHVKGQWHQIRAFKEVLKQIENAKLLIVGEGELEKDLKDLADKLGIADKVIFTGYIKNPHIVLQYSEMFIFSSLSEGLGNVLLEALAFNMPIVSVDCVAGPREILAPDTNIHSTAKSMELCKYGILVPAMDNDHFNPVDELTPAEKELSRAIVRMHQDEELREKYSRCAQKRIMDFDAEKIIESWDFAISS